MNNTIIQNFKIFLHRENDWLYQIGMENENKKKEKNNAGVNIRWNPNEPLIKKEIPEMQVKRINPQITTIWGNFTKSFVKIDFM